MGERAVTEAGVIDETFAGLAEPVEMHRAGRPDIEDGRPGDILVAEVRKFAADGGFKKIAEERDERRKRDDAAEVPSKRDPLPDFGVRQAPAEARDFDAGGESAD